MPAEPVSSETIIDPREEKLEIFIQICRKFHLLKSAENIGNHCNTRVKLYIHLYIAQKLSSPLQLLA